MAKSTATTARNDLIRAIMAEERERLRQRTIRMGQLVDRIEAYRRALDAARGIVRLCARDYGMGRREIADRFGLTARQVAALFEEERDDPPAPAEAAAPDQIPEAAPDRSPEAGSGDHAEPQSPPAVEPAVGPGPSPDEPDLTADAAADNLVVPDIAGPMSGGWHPFG